MPYKDQIYQVKLLMGFYIHHFLLFDLPHECDLNFPYEHTFRKSFSYRHNH